MSQQASPPDQASDPALRRVIVDLSDPVGAPPREIPPQKEQEQAKKKSYADLLKGNQDNAPPKRVKTVVNRPKPEYLSKLIDLASQEDANEEDVLEAISQATPIQVKKATTTMWIETNGALYDKVYTNEKIIDAIFKENQNAAWSYLLLEFVQLNKTRIGDIVVSVTSRHVKDMLAGKTISIFGKEFTIPVPKVKSLGSSPSQELNDPMDKFFFMDIVGIRFNFDSAKLFRLLRRLKMKPIFQAYRQHIPNVSCQSNVWRVYFLEAEVPKQLVVNGHPADRLKMDGVAYNVFVKNFERSASRTSSASPHLLDLDHAAALMQNPEKKLPEPEGQGAEDQGATQTKRAKVNEEKQHEEPIVQVVHSHTQSMNVVLTKLATHTYSDYLKVVRMHAWQRWMSATQLPVVDSFTNGFKFTFQEHPKWTRLEEISSVLSFFEDAPKHPAFPTDQVEDALAAFELWIAVQAPLVFRNDAWILYLTRQPVAWLPAKHGRMLAQSTLWALLKSLFGQYFAEELNRVCKTEMSSRIWQLSVDAYQPTDNSLTAFVGNDNTRLQRRNNLLY
ncbi:unnamed protein product [Aphanomyces euteiches]